MAEKDVVPMTAEERKLVELFLEGYSEAQKRSPQLRKEVLARARDPRHAEVFEHLKKKAAQREKKEKVYVI